MSLSALSKMILFVWFHILELPRTIGTINDCRVLYFQDSGPFMVKFSPKILVDVELKNICTMYSLTSSYRTHVAFSK
jgi:hypothetical protein